jgi:hypothetical protein
LKHASGPRAARAADPAVRPHHAEDPARARDLAIPVPLVVMAIHE